MLYPLLPNKIDRLDRWRERERERKREREKIDAM